jgi:hypothetical protein
MLLGEALCVACEGAAGCAEEFESDGPTGCAACSGTSCAVAELENARVNAAAARRKEFARISAGLRRNPLTVQS